MGTRIKTRLTPRIRVLAFCMALMICWVSVVQNFRVYAETTTVNGYGVAKTNGAELTYTYTGNKENVSVSLYDYVSDIELMGKTMDSRATGFTDAYTAFNRAISDSASTNYSVSGNNITFKYKPDRVNVIAAYMYFFDGSSHHNQYPGYPMTYDYNNNEFTLTVNPADIKNYSDSAVFTPTKFAISGVDMMSEHKYNQYFQTDDITMPASTGGEYRITDYKETSGTANSITFRLYNDTSRVIKLGNNHNHTGLHLRQKYTPNVRVNFWDSNGHYGEYKMTGYDDYWEVTIYQDTALSSGQKLSQFDSNFNVNFKSDGYFDATGASETGDVETDAYSISKTQLGKKLTFDIDDCCDATGESADNMKNCLYSNPLYFGCFWLSDTPSDYNQGRKPRYNNFYWQANLSQQTTAGQNASVQGVVNASGTVTDGFVDSTLNGSGQLTSGGQVLPYFNSTFNTHLLKYYGGLSFPFYEISIDPTAVRGGPSSAASGEKAIFHQFYSGDKSVYYNKTENKLEENSNKIYSQANVSNVRTAGFYPFNKNNDTDSMAPSNNLGFGARFDINFQLNEDGKVYTMKDGEPTSNKVDALFEFQGDDDVWVYIDNRLVLDLGGAHTKTTGSIDFATTVAKAYANQSLTLGTSSKDKLDVSTSSTENNSSAIGVKTTSLINGATGGFFKYDASNPETSDLALQGGNYVYNKNKTHTLTVFYMERGMYESNLLIRYNYETIPNTNTMTIKEETNFDNINPGLKNATKKAAESDVFRYTIQNTGTTNDMVDDSGILYPTYDKYVRTNEADSSLKTTLTSTAPVPDTTHIYLDTSALVCDGNTKPWDSGGAKICAYFWDSTNGDSAKTFLMQSVGSHLYRVEIGSYQQVNFVRVTNDCPYSFPYEGYVSTTNPNYRWNKYNVGSFVAGASYKINSSDDGYRVTTTPKNTYPTNSYNYNPTASGNYVSGVSYEWVDNFAELDGSDNDGIKGMTGKTTPYNSAEDTGGALYLMYGTSDNESSAKFIGQFARKTNSVNSTMTIVQDDELYEPDGATPHVSFRKSTSTSAAARNVSDYYTTTVTAKDYAGNSVPFTNHSNSTTVNNNSTVFDYKNDNTVSENYPVQITETFENMPKLGAITITKSALDPADTIPDTETFTLKIQFTKVFGQEVTVTPAEYGQIQITHSANRATTLTTTGEFVLGLGESVTINNIPVNSEYVITETADNYQIKTGSSSGLSGTIAAGTLNGGETTYIANPQNYTGKNTSTVVNTRLLGTLELKKALTLNSTQKLNGSDIGDTTQFTYKVTLESPNEANYKVKLSDYISGIKKSDNTSLSWQQVGGSQYKYECTVNVSKNNPVTIEGIPYGTTYTVEETTTGPFTNNGSKTGTVNKTTPAASATITNTTPNVGSLTLTKSLQGDYSSYIDTDTKTYTLNAVLTPNGYNLSDFIRSADLPSGVTFNSSTNTITAVVNYSNPSVTIGNIPYGTKYTVSEVDANTSPMTTSYDYQYNTHSTDGIQAATQTATVTNTYPGSLTIRKSVAGGAPTTLPDYFIMDVTFNFPDSSQHTLSAGTFQHGTSTEVSVPKNGSIKITGIPLGTTYTIQEDKTKNSLPSNLTIGGQVTTAETINVGSPAADKTITNTYPAKGSLVLTKTRTGNAPTTAMDYYVDVTFTPNHGENLRHYLTAIETYRQSDYVYRIPVSVAANSSTGSFTINDIPTGTDYSVTEYTTGPFTTEYTNEIGTTNDSQTDVEITNTYQNLGTLAVTKAIAGDNPATPETYTIVVSLTSTDYELNRYNISSSDSTSPVYSNSNYTCTFTLTMNKDDVVTISNIPYDTEYTVTETGVSSNVDVKGQVAASEHKKVDLTTPSATETITNTYLGTLTLNKALTTGSPASANTTDFDFKVKLIPPSGVTLSNYTLTDSSSSKNSVNPNTFTPNAQNEFTVKVQKDKPVTISGIPFGTKYTIEEINEPSNVNVRGEVAQSANKKVDATYTAPSETITNTYLGELKLQKTRNGEIPSTPPSSYQFNVTLKEPNGVKLTDYNDLSSYTVTPSGTTQITYSFSVNVAPNGEVSIPNLPYGTEYTVEEAGQASLPTNTIVAGEVKTASPETIDAATETVNIINTYPGSLELKKKLSGTLPPEVTATTPFTFNVTLTNTDKSSFKVKVDGTEQDVTSGTQFTVNTVSSDHSVKIAEIPVGTEYLVTEAAPATSPDSTTGNMTEAVKITASDATKEVEITNTYSYTPPVITKSITLTKTDLNGNPLSGVTFALLKLNSGVDENNTTATSVFANTTKTLTDIVPTYATQVGSNQATDASGHVTFTEGQDSITTFENGDRYFFYEVSVPDGSNIIIDNSLTDAKIITISDGTSYNKTYTNRKTVSSVDVTVKKVDESDPSKGLKDAEFELWYKDSTVHPTYTFNDPLTAPLRTTALKVSGNGITVPAAAEPSSYTTYDYTYTYGAPSTPSAEETEWILPRTDNDYIYFRDFESGTADHDPGLSKHAWLKTWFEPNTTSGVHGQDQEIGYDHKYWFAAQFRKSDNSGFVEYAVWERFVDKITSGGTDYDTIVWKIQPPDGYSKVRFCLYDGSNCIRTTEEFDYQLGKIYQKTSWGGTYRYQNNKHCYFNVPVNDENPDSWSTYYSTISSSYDQRNANTTSLHQAERYEPTEQKIIFHCNSQQVWHNIHIEFFGENQTPIHQKFPGYMMEPYAYAGSDYRLSNGYLTYELTIPSDAKYFRINNGIDNSTTKGSFGANSSTQSPYAYRTNIQEISTSGNKNNDNYYILGDNINARYNCLNGTAPKDAVLTKNVTAITNLSHEDTSTTYSSNEVESDCDYVYFAKKKTDSSWNDHIYAYFYGGGNLREDNWQRACYSIWPGVAPVGTQFNDGSGHDSTIYDYTPSANPESTFTIKKGGTEYTVYKFRMPEGDRKNYSKVIFNDGLKQHSGSKETSPITYNAGYIYFEDGGSMQHFDNYSTTQYAKRSGANDYLYIKTADTAWDDMHITFYRSDGSQIHQGGTGYVMKYAGTSGGETYYRIPIPADADKFKLNNGRDKATSLETDFGDILRKSDHSTEGNKVSDYTEGKIVYTLDNTNKLTMEPLFTSTETHEDHTGATQDSLIDYSHTRGDKLYIRNTASWNIGAGGGQVKFYNSSGTLITGDTTGGNGTYILIKTVDDSGSPAKEWYSIEIPDNAVSFTLTYNNGANTTARNPIYPLTAGADGNYTEGNMYYQTTSGGALSLMTTTVSPATAETDITAAKRGDTLYLLCTDKDAWDGMTVTFLNSSGTAITGAENIAANYIGKQGSDYWWSISIPTGAASFTVTKGGNTTTAAEIYPLSQKLSRYKKDYTLGDMQYRLPASVSNDKPGLLYPIFTQDDEYTLEVGGKTITTSSGTALIDESDIADYVNTPAVTTPATTASEPTSPYPVLYSTTTDNLTYSWTEGSTITDTGKIYYKNSNNWNTVYIHLWGGTNSTTWTNNTSQGVQMTNEGNGIWSFNLSSSNYSNSTHCIFNNNGSEQTINIEIPNDISTQSQIYKQQSTLIVDPYYVYVQQPSGGSWNDTYATFYHGSTELQTVHTTGNDQYTTTDNHTINNVHKAKIPMSGSPDGVMFHNTNSSSSNQYSSIIKSPFTAGHLYTVNSGTVSGGASNLSVWDGGGVEVPEWNWSQYGTTSTTTYTATYQPEDRYGFITNRDDYSTTPADTNNFIYISTTISDPYITFYSDTEGTSKIGGNDMAAAGIKLKGVCGNTASPYKIRLPRNAKSFKLADGASGTLGTAIPLEETIYVKTDRTITNSSDTSGITMTNYRHAGTTFTATSTSSVTATTLRSGFTISREAALSETSPKSDIDYVFFTDTSNTIKGTDGTVYAYFYGSADGEFAHWPGIQAESSYTDSNNATVYRFRIPKDTNGTYAKVIFNNGSGAGRKITQAVDATGGYNYALENSTVQYGTYDGTNAINAYAVSGTPKAAAGSAAYGSNRYIYIYNNGTQNLTSGQTVSDTTDRYKLDEMHVIFYDINNALIGPASSGYVPDKLSGYTDYYRMQVPNGAVYFQITNGEGKGSGSNYYSRQSEIKQITANGLYEFVSGKTNAADYITADSTVPTDAETRQNPKYLLTLSNEKKAELDDDIPETSTFDVKLAVVVTDTDGTQKYIKWLKKKNGEVDQVYLNHTNADVGATAGTGGNGIKVVSVVKNGTYYWKEVVAPAGYELNKNTFEFIKNGNTLTGSNITSGGSITVPDKKISGKVILTKTAKEKVGTTNIGDPLEGAVFKVFNSDGTAVTGFTGTYTTNSEGKLTIEGLSPGDYYLEEQTAPAGFVETDSNNVVNGTAQKKKVYFSIGDNTSVINLTCSDEMAPAYIKLYEHINEKLPAWGDPTFIFKITQTGHYKNDGTSDIETISNGKTMIVALTVDDDGKLTSDEILGDTYNNWYQESTDELEGESPNQTLEYQGMYHIDNQGRIRLEPGTYSITRVPVSRYEFVANTWKLEDAETSVYTTNKKTESNKYTGEEAAIQNVTIPQGKTALVHYYDKVAYYDKFSHVDEEINKFYTLDASKNNTTAKGIRVKFNGKANTSGTATIYTAQDNSTSANTFNAWFINVDGTERAMTATEKANLVISDPNSQFTSGDFVFNDSSKQIQISNTSNYVNKVFTLKAVYKKDTTNLFETTFDIVFSRS